MRLHSILLGIVVGGLGIAGCGNGDDNSTPAPVDAAADSTTAHDGGGDAAVSHDGAADASGDAAESDASGDATESDASHDAAESDASDASDASAD
jgi:hypothetical protein